MCYCENSLVPLPPKKIVSMSNNITIAIDGFAACGKSTLAKQLAQRLSYIYVDTGAMYRAVTLYFERYNVAVDNVLAVSNALANIHISFVKNQTNAHTDTYLNGENVEQAIRSSIIANKVSLVSAIKAVRTFLVEQQQVIGKDKGVVMDGRDIGTVVFPDAALKLFLTADIEVRTQRRYEELQSKNMPQNYGEVQKNLQERDHLDSTRQESPLRKASDAVVIDNSNLTAEEQLAMVLALVRCRVGG